MKPRRTSKPRQGTARRAEGAGKTPRHRPTTAVKGETAWLLRCAPGLARVLELELRYDKLLPPGTRVDVSWQRGHDLLFLPRLAHAPKLAELRIAEDVFRCLIYGRYKISEGQLDRLAAQLKPMGKRVRIVVSAEGTHFNRHDLARWLAKQLAQRGLRPEAEAGATVFVFCVDQAYYVATRTRQAAETAGRARRAREREGSLPPTVAAAMAFLGKPGRRDTVLDPVCGSGTLLAEAHAYAPAATLHGIDTDQKAIKTARHNLAGIEEATLVQGDAQATDLADSSVSLVLGNLPFGKQYGDAAENRTLYAALLDEMLRLAAPAGWRAVLLAADAELLTDAATQRNLKVDRRLPVRVRGEAAAILVLSKAGD